MFLPDNESKRCVLLLKESHSKSYPDCGMAFTLSQLEKLFSFYANFILLESGSGIEDPLIDGTQYAESSNASSAEGKSQFGVLVAAESGQRRFGFLDIHSLHNEQIVVK